MKYESITKQDILAIVDSLDDSITYNIHIEDAIVPINEIDNDIDYEDPSRYSHVTEDPSDMYFDKNKKVLEIITKIIENIYIDCKLEDITDTHGKLASITTYNSKLSANSIIVNTGTIKFKSICNNDLLLSLHIAECIFRQILYYDQGYVDVNKLDDLIDEFYKLYYVKLDNKYEK